jgi:hypothetical protein
MQEPRITVDRLGYDVIKFPKGWAFYKGFGQHMQSQGVTCMSLFDDDRTFYVSEDQNIATIYAVGGTLCKFQIVKPVELWILNHSNVQKLLESNILSRDASERLMFATGAVCTRSKQFELGRRLGVVLDLRCAFDQSAGERISIKDIDRDTFTMLCKEFLSKYYHGYYAFSKKSYYHRGDFHKEIMLCDASRVLARFATIDVPTKREQLLGSARVMSKASFDQNMSEIFGDFVVSNPMLFTAANGRLIPLKDKTIVLSGSMSLRLWIKSFFQKESIDADPDVYKQGIYKLDTSDFDMLFMMRNKFTTPEQVSQELERMNYQVSEYIERFIKFVNSQYPDIAATLIPPTNPSSVDERVQLPGLLDRRVYGIKTYKITLGTGKVVDLMDAALCHTDNFPHDQYIDEELSTKVGMYVPRLKFILRDMLAAFLNTFTSNEPRDLTQNPFYVRELPEWIWTDRSKKGKKWAKNIELVRTIMCTLDSHALYDHLIPVFESFDRIMLCAKTSTYAYEQDKINPNKWTKRWKSKRLAEDIEMMKGFIRKDLSVYNARNLSKDKRMSPCSLYTAPEKLHCKSVT